MSSNIFQSNWNPTGECWTVLGIFIVILLTASPVASAEPAPTVEEAVDRAISAETPERLGILNDRGVTLDQMLVAEQLPKRGASSEHYLVEFEANVRTARFRLPIAVRQVDAGWQVDWAPRRVYLRALLDALNGKLAELSDASVSMWADQKRTPAFPVIVAEEATVTPFGTVGGAPAGPISQTLSRHAARWLNGAMRGDDAAGSTDLIVHANVTWERIHTAIYQLASHGIFRLHFIGITPEDLAVVPALAPVKLPKLASTKDTGLPSLRVGLENLDDGAERWGLSVRGAKVDGKTASEKRTESASQCPDSADMCTTEPRRIGDFLEGLDPPDAWKGSWPPSLGIVACSSDASFDDVVNLLGAVSRGTGIPAARWMVTRFGASQNGGSQ